MYNPFEKQSQEIIYLKTYLILKLYCTIFVCAKFLNKATEWRGKEGNGNNTGFDIRQT